MHISVLPNEVIETFKNIKSGYIVDCTLGLGGHSKMLLEANQDIKMICIDRDIEALEIAKENLKDFKDRIEFKLGRFSDIFIELKEFDIKGILADIGVSSLQLDKMDRGFGFRSDKLDMRMDKNSDLNGYEVVNYYHLEDLEKIFKDYGELREYKKIAKLIVDTRKINKIESNRELAELIERHSYSKKIHPATLAFQAIRIEVNDELGELERLLKGIEKANFQDTLVAIISFHSLEDRIVKNQFKNWTKKCICHSEVFRCECGNNNAKGKIITKKPIIPTNMEIKNNPRSRSSKMRVFNFIKEKY